MIVKSQTREGLLIVISSPSGAGKTTVTRSLLNADDQLYISVSMTTRKPRSEERHGKDYLFVSDEEFEHHIKAGDMLEYAYVHGNRYGTPLKPVHDALCDGRDMIFDVDWQGAESIHTKKPEQTVMIFILPPTFEILEQRLRGRNQDSAESIELRLENAKAEINKLRYHDICDYVIENVNLQTTLHQIQNIITTERMRFHRQKNIPEKINDLLR